MKILSSIITLIFPLLLFSQSESLVDVTWHCTRIIIGGNEIAAPSNNEVASVTLELTNDNDPNTDAFSSGVCNSLTSSGNNITYNDPEMTLIISGLAQTLIVCGLTENLSFETNYFNFFYNTIDIPLSYTINTINDLSTLTIMAPNGDIAYYEAVILSEPDNKWVEINIHPNPTTNTITITTKINTIERIEIYAITGEILKSIKKPVSTIDVSKFSKGTYFLKAYSGGYCTIKQFIKK